MTTERFLVTRKAMRPGSPQEECFYCRQAIGATHLPDCVLIKHMVRLRLTVEYDVRMPAAWKKAMIESHRNNGTLCKNEAINELKALYIEGGDDVCMCDDAYFEYLGNKSEPFLDE